MKDRQDSIYKGFFSIVIPIVIQYLMSSMVGSCCCLCTETSGSGCGFHSHTG